MDDRKAEAQDAPASPHEPDVTPRGLIAERPKMHGPHDIEPPKESQAGVRLFGDGAHTPRAKTSLSLKRSASLRLAKQAWTKRLELCWEGTPPPSPVDLGLPAVQEMEELLWYVRKSIFCPDAEKHLKMGLVPALRACTTTGPGSPFVEASDSSTSSSSDSSSDFSQAYEVTSQVSDMMNPVCKTCSRHMAE